MTSGEKQTGERLRFIQHILAIWDKYKIGVIPENIRVAKPNSRDLMDIAMPSLIGIPILLVLYVIGDVTAFASGLAVVVALAILDASRPLRGGHWLGKPEEPVVVTEEQTKRRFLIDDGIDPEKWWGKTVQDTLNAYGIKANVVALDTSGASVDVYELVVQKGFDITSVKDLGDNFARSLGLPKGERVAVDANIGNGRAALYIPKGQRRKISTAEMIQQAARTDYALPGLVGEDLVGNALIIDIARAPHLLVGGEITDERAVQMLNMILSSAYSRSPEILKLTLVDPKRLEMAVCNRLPHMVEPVITDMQLAYQRLKAVHALMETRCQQLQNAGVGHIAGYNALHPDNPMPYHLIAFSELSMALKVETPADGEDGVTVGEGIKKLLLNLVGAAPTQAVGIHFLFGVQCFDAKTCGEALRQGIPSSIGLRVRGQSFSEMLIGQSGCETLTSSGDCYVLMSGSSIPVRAQVASASEVEIVRIVQAINEKWSVSIATAEPPSSEE